MEALWAIHRIAALWAVLVVSLRALGFGFAAAPWAVLLVVCGVEAPWAIHCSAALGAVFAVAFQALGHCSVQHCEGSMTNCRLCSSYLEATAFF